VRPCFVCVVKETFTVGAYYGALGGDSYGAVVVYAFGGRVVWVCGSGDFGVAYCYKDAVVPRCADGPLG
jgi:hypothetical protein